ncbi:hypothetical protein DXC78_10130 [Faecalicoccus pleomorphus]|uniref:Uncharacterized protein n=1 Tax=Faecalicoccus pleomorphus TaxID=1323 RepID=A0A3E3DXR5_9FIRM|nr:hypothetical protein DXC78_10130 [Faecalicoccus pleomorphus]
MDRESDSSAGRSEQRSWMNSPGSKSKPLPFQTVIMVNKCVKTKQDGTAVTGSCARLFFVL